MWLSGHSPQLTALNKHAAGTLDRSAPHSLLSFGRLPFLSS